MIVETFEIERADDETLNAIRDGEANLLVESLGLSGQERFYNPDTIEAIPYRKMTKDEGIVYGFLMPKKTEPAKYSDGLIPIRVLQVLQYAKSLDFFTSFEIWHPENADIKDPLLVGVVETKTQNSWGVGTNYERYLLARWGEPLDTFEVLRDCAKKLYREAVAAKLRMIRTEISAYLALAESGEEMDLSMGMPTFSK